MRARSSSAAGTRTRPTATTSSAIAALVDADEGLGRRAETLFEDLKAANYGDNGARRVLSRADRRGDRPLRARLSIATARYRTASAHGSPSFAPPQCSRSRKRIADARRYLADLPAVTIEQRVQVRQAEAQLLRDAGDNAGAYAVLAQALVEQPDQPDLLYDIAMVAEKLDKLDVVEARLAALIELKPDNAQALNALGYTLVDRTARIARRLCADRARLEARARRSVHPRQHGLGGIPDGQSRRRRKRICGTRSPSGRTRKSPRTWAKCCGRRASRRARRKSGSRS